MMDRRAFLGTLALLAASLPAEGQPRGGRMYRIGVLSPGRVPSYMAPFVETLQDLGWTETQDFMLEYRLSGETQEAADTGARELVALKADVIVTLVTGNAIAAQRATTEIPIVMLTSGYPVEVGLAKSYARPGGNITGNTAFAGTEVFGKHIEILKLLLPRLRRLSVLWGYIPPFVHPREGELALAELKQAANTLGVTIRLFTTRRMEDVESALTRLSRSNSDAVYVSGGSVHLQAATRIVDVSRVRRLPTMTDVGPVFQAGMLLSYAPVPAVLAQQAARLVDRILLGARPSELPIERPAKLSLMINLKTAKALGLTIPPSLLQRADRVIE
jgi:putative ABC transport system substrate-binding protein